MYILKWTASVSWVGDGAGPMSVPSAQTLKIASGQYGGSVIVPGGDAPSGANLTAAGVTAGVNIGSGLNTNLGQIQGFATGGG